LREVFLDLYVRQTRRICVDSYAGPLTSSREIADAFFPAVETTSRQLVTMLRVILDTEEARFKRLGKLLKMGFLVSILLMAIILVHR